MPTFRLAALIDFLRPRDRAALLRETLIFVFFLLLTVVMTWPLLPKAATDVVDIGMDDQLLAARCIREIMDWVFGNRSGLFDAAFFFPHPGVFATMDPGFGTALMLVPFRAFTDDFLLISNIGLLLTFPLTAHATYLLARDLTLCRAAGILSGIAFGFCLYRAHQLDHVSILQMQWFVYSLVYFHRIHRMQRWADGAAFAFFFFMNAIGSSSIALFTFAAYPFVGLWAIATARPGTRKRFLVVLGVSTLAATALFAPIYLRFVEAAAVYGMERGIGQAIHWAARVEQFHAVPPSSLLYGKTWTKYMGSESATFLGFGVLALAAIGLASPWVWRPRWPSGSGGFVRRAALVVVGLVAAFLGAVLFVALGYVGLGSPWVLGGSFAFAAVATGGLWFWRRHRNAPGSSPEDPLRDGKRAARLYLVVAVVFALLALGPLVIHKGKPLGPGVWNLVLSVPGFGSIRTPSRLFFVTSLCVSILAGVGFAVAAAAIPRRVVRWALSLVAFAAVLLESWVAPVPTRRLPTLADAPPVYRWLAEQPGRAAVAELPVGRDERGRIRRAHMFFGNIHKRPTVDDVASFDLPVIHWMNHAAAAGGSLALQLERLHSAGLGYVVLHRAQIPTSLHEAYARGIVAAGAKLVATFGPDVVYAFPAAAPPSRPFTAENVVAAIALAPRVADGGSLAVEVHLAPRGDYAVFEKRVRHLLLTGKLTLGKKTELFRKKLYLPPPLIAAAGRETLRAEFKVDSALRGKALATFSVADEHGAPWTSASTVLALADATAWDAEAARHPIAPDRLGCELAVVAKRQTAAGQTRVVLSVRNAGAIPWAGASARALKVAAVTAPVDFDPIVGVVETAMATHSLPAVAAGTALLFTFEMPAARGAAAASLVSPSGGEACATTLL